MTKRPTATISFVAIILTAAIFSCNSDKTQPGTDPAKNSPTVFDKMTGTWKSEDGKSFERWTKKADGSFQSVAFSTQGTDTSWNENARIYMENEKWVFENTVKGQNDGKPVKFTATLFDDKSVHFSNPTHDFPTDINYSVIDANTVHAYIVGPNNTGGKDTIPFHYTRYH